MNEDSEVWTPGGMKFLQEKLMSMAKAQEDLLCQQNIELTNFLYEHFELRSSTNLVTSSKFDLNGKELGLSEEGPKAAELDPEGDPEGPKLANVAFVRPSSIETEAELECSSQSIEPILETKQEDNSSQQSPASSKERRNSVMEELASMEEKVTGAVVDYGRKLLQSDNFSFKSLDLVVGVLIAINTIVMMIRNEYMGYEVGVALGAMNHNPLSELDWTLDALERGFAILFLIELVVRVAIQRCSYFRSCWNWFDVVLVLVSMFDLFLLDLLRVDVKINVNVTMMRLARTVKLARAFRIMRTLRLFEGLRVLVHSVSAFLPSLMWAMIFLGLFIITGGILLGGLLQSFLVDTSEDFDRRYWVWRHYGTASRAIYTMFEITFAGSWPLYARPVIEEVGVGYCIFFVAYIVFVVFAVIRVISAIFLKETLDAAQNDAQLVVREKAKASQEYVKRLNKVFQTMDLSQDGVVTKEEFLQLCQDPTIRSYMTSLDVDVNDGSHLFKLLDDGDGNLTYEEFIAGMMRFKGSAKAIDVIYLQREVEWIQQELLRLTDKLIGPNLNDKRVRRRSGRINTQKEHQIHDEKQVFEPPVPEPELPHEYLTNAMRS
ncbi:Sodium channel protein type 4 subunit alpha (Sodium channel protein skeletal muscle subunit alpha) (Sodium channel protein type IV subunit alpha) (Voltage-gated sodium channel subunit alpha Nav1.4) [Durusdinium trenchii]|uniref:Sodium channel protein type 4 subunit alpha (Sodium channel protein skeletal muscle subunit alpha) (Sodium channel protein type IV subunit alpha) (Voltage-gated sodium channel subunit alpha Nav1.4) n=3 Tax=Durusdinium trenchii TaxID=1381693 RepID=A0ABP0Q9J6_9DINO